MKDSQNFYYFIRLELVEVGKCRIYMYINIYPTLNLYPPLIVLWPNFWFLFAIACFLNPTTPKIWLSAAFPTETATARPTWPACPARWPTCPARGWPTCPATTGFPLFPRPPIRRFFLAELRQSTSENTRRKLNQMPFHNHTFPL